MSLVGSDLNFQQLTLNSFSDQSKEVDRWILRSSQTNKFLGTPHKEI